MTPRPPCRPPAALLLLSLWATGCLAPKDAELIRSLDAEIIAVRQKNAMLQAELANCSEGELESDLYAQLTQVFSGTEVWVAREGARSVVVIPGSVLFRPGETTIREEATMVLDLLATALKLHPDTQAWIIGHTDDHALSGTLKRKYDDNWGLSTARARAFMDRLVTDFEMDPDRFTVAGRGPSDPIDVNDTPEGRERNRRIVVVVGPAEQYR
ncbi:MAG: OmpA family protein [Alphaproteobacteria bacterium]|nr:OmpA family protein [Alphaproteobacteria bacterium]